MALLFNPFFTPVDGNGLAMPGALLNFYVTGTTTRQDTFTTSGLGTANANPVVADTNGLFPPIYLSQALSDYKAVLTTSAAVVVQTLDPLLVNGSTVITTQGDIIIGNAGGGNARLAIGAANTVLRTNGVTPSWGQVVLSTDVTGTLVATPVVARYTTNADLTVTIPYDDTIPQVGEGTQIFSQAFTAQTSTHRVRITCSGFCGNAGADTDIMALFIDGGANAVKAVAHADAGANTAIPLFLEYEAAQSAGAHTYSIRVGGAADTIRMNGTNAARRFGGVAEVLLTIEELLAP